MLQRTSQTFLPILYSSDLYYSNTSISFVRNFLLLSQRSEELNMISTLEMRSLSMWLITLYPTNIKMSRMPRSIRSSKRDLFNLP